MSGQLIAKNPLNNTYENVAGTSGALHVAQYVWDTNTLAWVKQTGSSGAVGSDVVVTNFPAVQEVSGTVATSAAVYTKRFDQADSTTAYLGEAAVGSSEASGVWRIKKLTFGVDGDVSILFADGDTSFDNVWSNRASLSYS
jgi:hypothetical protein